jgi:hypothetical protein
MCCRYLFATDRCQAGRVTIGCHGPSEKLGEETGSPTILAYHFDRFLCRKVCAGKIIELLTYVQNGI